MKSVFQFVFACYIAVLFLVTLCFFAPIIALLSIPNKLPFRIMIWRVSRFWSRLLLFCKGMNVSISGRFPDTGKNYVIVANHLSYLDALNLFVVIPHYFRALGKIEFSKIPVFGFIYRQTAVLVDRSSTGSRTRSMKSMWRVLEKECSIAIFPEGTFNETELPLTTFYDGAFKLAASTNTEVLPIIFPDMKERWHYSAWWKIWPGINRAIILAPIAPKGKDAKAITVLKNEVFDAMHKAFKEASLLK